ncbi:hypothetical protein HK405_002127, partial [Cladochytrium tenue]
RDAAFNDLLDLVDYADFGTFSSPPPPPPPPPAELRGADSVPVPTVQPSQASTSIADHSTSPSSFLSPTAASGSPRLREFLAPDRDGAADLPPRHDSGPDPFVDTAAVRRSSIAFSASSSSSAGSSTASADGAPPPAATTNLPSEQPPVSHGVAAAAAFAAAGSSRPALYRDLVRRTTPAELFFFDYGVVVMWGLTEEEEAAILDDIKAFEEESVARDRIEPEKFHFLYSRQQPPRIYNDIVTLDSPAGSEPTKLAISHAVAQSAKLTVFEDLIDQSIESTRHIPGVMAESGKIN